MDWDSDPELLKIKNEFIDSLSVRLAELKSITTRIESGPMVQSDSTSVQFLAHKLAGAAEPYGFSVLTRISGAVDDLLSLNEKALGLEPMTRFLKFLQDALTLAVQSRNDPDALSNDPRMKELISAVEALHD